MGAAFLCGFAGIENITINNSVAYIQGWLKALKDDQEACDYEQQHKRKKPLIISLRVNQ